jgi:hypothetical protein
MGKDASEIRRKIEETRSRLGDTVEALSYKADVPARVKDAVNARVETVKETIGDVMSNVKDAVGGVKQRAAQGWSETAERVPSGEDVKNAARRGVGIAAENPLGLAIGAAALGFLAGLLMPVTDMVEQQQSAQTHAEQSAREALEGR